jgi:uncharacterized protein (TIGR02246 family)
VDDYGEIVSLLARVMRAHDDRDRDLLTSCWTEDAEFEVVFHQGPHHQLRGRDHIVDHITSTWTGPPSSLRHQMGAVEVELDSNGDARARFYASYFNTGDAAAFAGFGHYDNLLAKDSDGRWRIRQRRHLFLTPLAR